MPVLIFAPNSEMDIIRPLATRLREAGGEVRCYLPEDDFELREIGCKLAVGDLTDDLNLEAALTNVHTFIPLFPDPAAIQTAEEVDRLIAIGDSAGEAARASSPPQTILTISAVARTDSQLGKAYRQISEAFAPVRPKAVFEVGLLWGSRRPFPRMVGNLTPSLSVPVLDVSGLVSILVAADDHENLHGTWELAGRTETIGQLRELAPQGSPSTALITDALATDLVLGSSAEEMFKIEVGPIVPVISN